jgi:hypothetical protein
MSVTVRVAPALRKFVDHQATLDVTAGSVLDVLVDAGLGEHVLDFGEEPVLRGSVNVYLGDEDVRFLPDGLGSQAVAGAEVTVLVAVAGG